MKEKYLIDKNYFIDEFEKFYDHPWVALKELSMQTFFVGKCGKYEIHCNYNKEWFLYDENNEEWIDIEPVMLPDDVYERYKDMYKYSFSLPLNDVERMLKAEGATDALILDLCELTDMLNNHLEKDIKVEY